MPRLLLAGTLMFLVTGSAIAQDGNPGGMEPGTDLNAADRVFAIAFAQGGRAEVELGELARKHGSRDPVKDFARHMITDHTKANDKFSDIAKKEGLKLPKDLDPEHKAMAKKLDDLNDRKFDVEYMKGQIADHQKAAQLLEHEMAAGQNTVIKDFASATLPTVLMHLKMAQEVMSKLTGQALR
jgi:putative membrane protein